MDRGLGPVASDRRTSLGRESTSVGTGLQRFRDDVRSNRLALTKKVTILNFVLEKMNAES